MSCGGELLSREANQMSCSSLLLSFMMMVNGPEFGIVFESSISMDWPRRTTPLRWPICERGWGAVFLLSVFSFQFEWLAEKSLSVPLPGSTSCLSWSLAEWIWVRWGMSNRR